MMIAVASLKQADVLSNEQAQAAYEKIQELSENVAKKVQRTLGTRRPCTSTFFRDLAEDSPLRKMLPQEVIKRIGKKHGKLLTLLFENRERVISFEELLSTGWDNPTASINLLRPRIQELRDRIEPFMTIDSITGQGYQLTVKEPVSS